MTTLRNFLKEIGIENFVQNIDNSTNLDAELTIIDNNGMKYFVSEIENRYNEILVKV